MPALGSQMTRGTRRIRDRWRLPQRAALRLLLSFWLFPLISASAASEDKSPVRIGVLGLDNYQAVAYAQLFNDPKATGDLAGVRVVAAYPVGSPDIEESVE